MGVMYQLSYTELNVNLYNIIHFLMFAVWLQDFWCSDVCIMSLRNQWILDNLTIFGDPGSAGKSSNTGVIVGAVVGGIVVFFAILALVLYYLCVYKPKKRQKGALRLADPLFIRSGGNFSGSASDHIHSCEYQCLVAIHISLCMHFMMFCLIHLRHPKNGLPVAWSKLSWLEINFPLTSFLHSLFKDKLKSRKRQFFRPHSIRRLHCRQIGGVLIWGVGQCYQRLQCGQ